MKFPIYRVLLDFFLNFYEFNSIYFELYSLKYRYPPADVAGDMARMKKRVITWRRMDMPHDHT